MKSDDEILGMELWAWVGEDDATHTGELGIKQAHVPAGLIPMVACKRSKMTQPLVADQMRGMARLTGVKRYLVRFRAEAVEAVEGDTGPQ